MLARLGDVLYWLGCGIAWLILAGTAVTLYFGTMAKPDQWVALAFAAICALVIWLIGRAARYVLSGI